MGSEISVFLGLSHFLRWGAMVAADDVITNEERRFLRRRSEDLRILRGKERDRKTEVIRRIGYILIACYFIRAFAIFLAHQYAVTELVFLHLHYPVDALTVITRFGFLLSFAVAYFYFLDEPRVIASVSIAGISVNGLLILLDVEWWYQTMLDYDLLFIVAFVVRLLCLVGLIYVHLLIRQRDG